MGLLALSDPTGQSFSWIAALLVILGVVGLTVGMVLQVRRRAD